MGGLGCIHPGVAFKVAFINVLEQGGTFLPIKFQRVGSRQALVEHVFNGEFEL